MTLPGVSLSWTQVVPGAGESFVQYNVYRDDVRIATIAAIATVTWPDYGTESGQSHNYAVTWTGTIGTDSAESAKQSPEVAGVVTFPFNYLHNVKTPTAYLKVLARETKLARQQELAFLRARGRSAPTAFLDEGQSSTIDITVASKLLASQADWQTLAALQQSQRDSGSVFLFRPFYTNERYFVIITAIPRDDGLGTVDATASLQEVNYDEAV